MNNLFKVVFCLLMLYIIGISCSNENKVNSNRHVSTYINPNGDSELTIFMRSMYDDLHKIKLQIAEGDAELLNLDHEKILTTLSTEPEKISSKEYQAFAQSYLNAQTKMNAADESIRKDVYISLVKNCVSCHQSLCPGPIVKINKLL